MKKICFLTSTLNYGGATKILVELANYLSLYHKVIIVNYGEGENFYKLNANVEVIKAPHTKCKIPKLRMLCQMMLLRAFFRKEKYDLIIAFGNTEKIMALSSSIGRRTKVIISERQDPYNYHPGKKHTMWLRYLLADGCVFQTRGAMEYFPEAVKKKSVVIPNFILIDDKKFMPIEKKKKEIAFSARFELRQKRQDVMINAMKIVASKYPDWKLVFYGDGDDQPDIIRLVKKYQIENNVVFAGKVRAVNECIYQSSIMALSSDYEGIPNVIIEAMAMGVPVVATDCSPGGARLLIKNKENGLIVPIGDYKKLADAIIFFIENPNIANEYAKKAMEVKKKYSPDIIFPLWKSYFEKIMGY